MSESKCDEKMDVIDDKPAEFQLSQQLTGHEYSVRDIAVADSLLLVTVEERGRVHVYDRLNESTQFTERNVLVDRVHLALTFVIECVRDRQGRGATHYPPLTFMTGGGDNAARPFTANGSILEPLEGHGKSVNSIAVTGDGMIVTGAWDGIIRLWYHSDKRYEIVGHEHGVEVLVIDDRIISGSANKAIHIHQHYTNKPPLLITKIPNAHDHSIRKLVRHPLGFASAGNDGVVKVWSVDGECLQTIHAHTTSEVKFVYGLAVIPDTNDLVTCGEDGNVKVFDFSGSLVQTIVHPSPVRAVKALPNNDIVTAGTDRVARVWTRSSARRTNDSEIADYNQTISMMVASGMKSLDTDTMPDESALTKPGTKDGQVLIVNVIDKGPTAYQWSDEAQTWVEIGQALGRSSKQMVDGVAYDFVTDVFVDETNKVKLGFNRDEDPLEVADRFCALHGLPADAKAQIVEHVRPMTDPLAAAQRKQREAEEAEEASLKHVPAWRQGGMEIYATTNVKAMRERLLQSNTALSSLSNVEVAVLESVLTMIGDARNLHSSPWTAEQNRVLVKLLSWPTSAILPVIDCMRVCLVHTDANSALTANNDFWSSLHRHVAQSLTNGGKTTVLVLYIKLVSNFIAKRKRLASERSNGTVDASTRQRVLDSLSVIERASVSVSESDSVSVDTAYVMLMHNLVTWLGRINAANSDCQPLYAAITAGIVRTLSHSSANAKIHYYGLLALGSIAYAIKTQRDSVTSVAGESLKKFVRDGLANDNPALREVSADVKQLYNLSP